MRRAVPLIALSLTLAASAAFAAETDKGDKATPSAVSKAFGNTIVSTYPDGRKGELWLQAGGAYSASGRKHDPSSGHWSVKGDQLCLKQSKPIPVPVSFCTPLPSGGMGQAWKAKAVSGEQVSVKLVKGRAKG